MSELVKALRDAYEETDKVYFNLRTIIKDAADTIDRLTAEMAAYKATGLTAEEFKESVDFNLKLNKAIKQATGKTALDWEQLTAENTAKDAEIAQLTEQRDWALNTANANAKLFDESQRRLAEAVEDINHCMTLLEKIHGHWPCELCSKDGKCVTCHPVWRGEGSE